MTEADVMKFYAGWEADSEKIQKAMPDMLKGFGTLFKNTMKADALDVKTKELIAVAIGLALRCQPCIYLHVKKSIEVGATRQEILAAAGVVVMMQGGPAYVYMPILLDVLEALGETE